MSVKPSAPPPPPPPPAAVPNGSSSKSSSPSVSSKSHIAVSSPPPRRLSLVNGRSASARKRRPRVVEKPWRTPTQRLSHMRLMRVVKENHLQDILHIALNMTGAVRGQNSNVVASVGSNQLSIYDSRHCGNHLDIMCNFTHESSTTKFVVDDPTSSASASASASGLPTRRKRGRAAAARASNDDALLMCVVWLKFRKNCSHLAVGCISGEILLIDLNHRRVERVLKGHRHSVPALDVHPKLPHVLASCCPFDQEIRLWNCKTGACVAVMPHCSSTRVIFHPSGDRLIAARDNGSLIEWSLRDLEFDDSLPAKPTLSVVPPPPANRLEPERMKTIRLPNAIILKLIEDVLWVDEQLLICWSSGPMELWDPTTQKTVRHFSFKNTSNESCLGRRISARRAPKQEDQPNDAWFFAAGGSSGGVYVWRSDSSDPIAFYSCAGSGAMRTASALRPGSVAMSVEIAPDFRTLLASTTNGLVMRYDVCDPSRWTGKRPPTDNRLKEVLDLEEAAIRRDFAKAASSSSSSSSRSSVIQLRPNVFACQSSSSSSAVPPPPKRQRTMDS